MLTKIWDGVGAEHPCLIVLVAEQQMSESTQENRSLPEKGEKEQTQAKCEHDKETTKYVKKGYFNPTSSTPTP